ncbi:MAG: hypothetical protein KGR98_08195, partial [Verrucomicrobia bacterium]|nr:hypothetical protein [Verrucomicrobiota bacterium]
MRRDGAIIRTNGVEVANPVLLKKLGEGRVMGTLVYPNALAGGILLLWPLSLVLACARKLRPAIRAMALAITVALGASGLLWSGSKAGWLIALAIGGLGLLRLQWPAKLKLAAIAAAIVIGLAVFAVRFHHYFALGATSLAARFDYWRAALQITTSHPWLG